MGERDDPQPSERIDRESSAIAVAIPYATMPKTIVNPAMKLVETSSMSDWSSRRSPLDCARELLAVDPRMDSTLSTGTRSLSPGKQGHTSTVGQAAEMS